MLPRETPHFEFRVVVVEDELWEVTVVEELEEGIKLVEVGEDEDKDELDKKISLLEVSGDVDEDVDEEVEVEVTVPKDVEEEEEVGEEGVTLLDVIEVDDRDEETTSEEEATEELIEVEITSEELIELKILVTVELFVEELEVEKDEEEDWVHAVNIISISDKGKV